MPPKAERAPSPTDGFSAFGRELRKARRISLCIRSSQIPIEVARRSRQNSDARPVLHRSTETRYELSSAAKLNPMPKKPMIAKDWFVIPCFSITGNSDIKNREICHLKQRSHLGLSEKVANPVLGAHAGSSSRTHDLDLAGDGGSVPGSLGG